MNETIKTLIERRSCRAYEDRQISEEELKTILEAGTFAPPSAAAFIAVNTSASLISPSDV